MSERQTHIRVFNTDKKILDFIMRRKRLKSQAAAFRWILKKAKGGRKK